MSDRITRSREAERAPPLSEEERADLLRILGDCASAAVTDALEPRQRAALAAYVEVLSTPPLSHEDVVHSARALIRVWADVERHLDNHRARARRAAPIFATLLELDSSHQIEPHRPGRF